MMRATLKAILIAGGAAAILISIIHIVFGPSAIPGSVRVNATMDSEDRFYAAIFLGFGIALLWCARAIERRVAFIRFLVSIFFLGGLARIISVLRVGPPNLFFQAMTALELLLPVVIWPLLAGMSARESNEDTT